MTIASSQGEVMQEDHRLIVKKSGSKVYLVIDDMEYELSPYLARQAGDAMYKAGCDVQAALNRKDGK